MTTAKLVPAPPAGPCRIEDRLLPLPRSVRCDGWWAVPPDRVHVVAEGDDPALRLAAEELAVALHAPAPRTHDGDLPPGALRVRVRRGQHAAIPATGYQAYAVVPDAHGLDLIGAEPVGATYAVKTLKQAVVPADGTVYVPRVAVSDAADLAERGFWDYLYPAPIRDTSEMYTLRTVPQWRAFLDDLADYKLNLLELLVWDEGLYYNSTRFPDLVEPGTPADKNDLVREVIDHARRCGIRLYLTLCHPEHFSRLRSTHPELAAVDPVGITASGFEHMFCFSHPECRRILAGIAEEVAEMFQPDGICAWMPEHLGQCTCSECAARGYMPQFFDIYRDAFARIHQHQPRLRMRFLVSFLRHSDAVLRMVPDGAELGYYECDRHGLYGADDDKRLPAHLAAAAQAGRRLLGCTSFRGIGHKYVPVPCLENVAEWVRLLVRDGYAGVSASIYSNPTTNRVNILRGMDVAWNAAGRESEAYLRAYGTCHGHDQPVRRARALHILSDGWEQYHRKQGVWMERHALDCLLSRHAPNVVDAFYVTDALEFRDLPALRQALADLDVGVDLARALGDVDIQRQFRVCQIRLGAMVHILSALHVRGRQQWPDPVKGPWQDWIAEITRHLEQARVLLEELPDVTRHIVSCVADVRGDPTVTDEPCLARLAKALDPAFLQDLAERAWPSMNADP